ncbi:hypothetical protein D3C76_165590 [compost metagenome]
MAGIQSHYEINVSYKGRHLFATDARSAVDENTARSLVNIITERFPAKDGFSVTCTHYRCGGTTIDFDAPQPQRKTLDELEQENPDGFRNPE